MNCVFSSLQDDEGIFYDGEHKKVWRAKPRFDVFQIMRTVAEEGENLQPQMNIAQSEGLKTASIVNAGIHTSK